MDCIAIDFETANEERSSPCSVGVVVVKNGQVANTFYRLIQPKDNYFDPFNISIHGITPEDVENQPEFPIIWEELRPFLQSGLVIAHNASFDMSVLRHTLELYGLPFPAVNYTCSRIIAKKAWPDLLSFALSVVAAHLGIELDHHNALSDANASALVALRACQLLEADSLEHLSKKTGIVHGCIMEDGTYFPASGCSSSGGHRIDVKGIVPRTDHFDEGHPFFDRVFAFTGTLCMSRRDAMQCVVDLGGQVGNGVTKDTNFIVVGEQDFRKFADGQTKSSKLRKAEDLKQKGQDIELLSERDFLEMIEKETA